MQPASNVASYGPLTHLMKVFPVVLLDSCVPSQRVSLGQSRFLTRRFCECPVVTKRYKDLSRFSGAVSRWSYLYRPVSRLLRTHGPRMKPPLEIWTRSGLRRPRPMT